MTRRGPLCRQDYKPHFLGHETFPLRYGWLKKVYDRVSRTERNKNNKALCWGDNAIALFGVGKNMVASMRHWSIAAGIIEEPLGANKVITTKIGRQLFGNGGLDPYLEHQTSLWLIHWKLATEWKKKTTWFWAFNHYYAVQFEQDKFVKRLERLAKHLGWPHAAHRTIKNDVVCFIRTYTTHPLASKTGCDDLLGSPLAELGLIKPFSRKGEFRFVHGPKSTLGKGAFVYALLEFWSNFSPATSTLSFEAITYEPGSPGRAFLLDENDAAERLSDIDDITGGALRWSETAGLKQVVRNPGFAIDSDYALRLIKNDYDDSACMKAA